MSRSERAAAGRQGRHQSSRTGITSDCIANQFLHRLKLHGVQPGRIVPFATSSEASESRKNRAGDCIAILSAPVGCRSCRSQESG